MGGLLSVLTFCFVSWKSKGGLGENWYRFLMLFKHLPQYLNISQEG